LTVTVPAVDAANNVRVEICPRCEGHGTLGMYVFRNPPEAKICSSCNGTGKLSPVA
jgi:DnaJ-class molecular chaperone